MSGPNGLRRLEIADPDLQWWVRFGARIEARQHLGTDLRQKLIEHVEAAVNGADRIPEWATTRAWNSGRSRRSLAAEPWFDPSIRLGLYDTAWKLQQVLASGSPVVPDLPLDVDHPNCTEYAWWLLSERTPCPPPEYVSSTHRAAAFWILGNRAPADAEIQDWLLKRAKDRAATGYRSTELRGLAMAALQWAAANAQDREALTCLLDAANDPADPLRTRAIASLRAAAMAGEKESLELLVQAANGHSDPPRDDAVHTLRWVVWLAQPPALDRLREIARKHAQLGKQRFQAIELLGWAAGEGRPGALRLLLGISRSKDDPDRQAAISALSWAAGIGQPEVLPLLCDIAEDRGDRERAAAIRALAWAGSKRVERAKVTLAAIAGDQGDAEQGTAAAALQRYA